MPTGKEAVPRPLEQQENPPITNPQNYLLRTEERLKHKYGQNIDPNDVPKLLPQLQALAPKIETLLAENNIPRILLESGLYDTVVRNIESQKFNKPSHFKVVLEGFSTAEVERQIRICKADMVPFGFGDIFREDTDESFGKAVKAKDHEDGSDFALYELIDKVNKSPVFLFSQGKKDDILQELQIATEKVSSDLKTSDNPKFIQYPDRTLSSLINASLLLGSDPRKNIPLKDLVKEIIDIKKDGLQIHKPGDVKRAIYLTKLTEWLEEPGNEEKQNNQQAPSN